MFVRSNRTGQFSAAVTALVLGVGSAGVGVIAPRIARAQCPDPSFADLASYSVPAACKSVAIGDMNGDGHLDLVVCYGSTSASNVGVMLNAGSGTFGAPVVTPVAGTPGTVAVGDLNGDGHLDVVLTYTGSGLASTVAVLLGNGDGTLQAAVNYTVVGSTRQVVVGDLNGDGWPDVAVATGTTSGVSVLLNNGPGGGGTLRSAVQYGGSVNALYVAVGDFDHDGHADLAMMVSGGTVGVMHGVGDGTFAAPVSYGVGQGISVAAGDLNGDGYDDLVCGTSGSGSQVTVLLNDGAGGFAGSATYAGATSPQAVAIADFNGDGHRDIVATSIVSGVSNSYVYRNNGDGTFQAGAAFATLLNNYRVAAADLSGDGKADFVVTSSNQSAVVVMINNTGPCAPAGVCCRGATCSTTVADAGQCAGSVPAGSTTHGVWMGAATACNAAGNSASPCCYADYDKMNGVQVADIFAMLNDWFAGYPFVILGGDGVHGTLAVQNIFDFLNAWFGGC
jgi:hypothetical protein